MSRFIRLSQATALLLTSLSAPAAAQYGMGGNGLDRPAGVRLERVPTRAAADQRDATRPTPARATPARPTPMRLATPVATARPLAPTLRPPLHREPAIAAAPARWLDPRGCELHVWGGERMEASSRGVLGNMGFSALGLIGSLVDGMIHADDRARDRQHMSDTLATPGQVAALGALDLSQLTGLEGYRIVTHAEPMIPAVANRDRRRHAQSTSPCYAELMVTRVVYDRNVADRTLRVSFLFRDFGDQEAPRFTFAGRGGNPMRVVRGGDQSLATSQDLVSVFQANFREYARNLVYRRNRG